MGLKIDYITRGFLFSDSDIVKIKRINNKLKKEEQRIRNYITKLQEVLKNQIQENIIDGFTIDSCSIFWDSANNAIQDISFHSTDFLFQAPTIIKGSR